LSRGSGNIKARSSLFVRLAVQHLGHRPLRAALLAIAVAVGGGAVFSASVLRESIQNSLGVSFDRMAPAARVSSRFDTPVDVTEARTVSRRSSILRSAGPTRQRRVATGQQGHTPRPASL
jgi:hypothetical protein